jgi:serine/threonine protein kinase
MAVAGAVTLDPSKPTGIRSMSDRRPDSIEPNPVDRTRPQTTPPQTQDFSIDHTNPSFGSLPPGGVPGYPFLSPPQAPDEIGRLGEYRILAKLGEGGMGFVFRAEETALRRSVALKVMRPEVAAKAQAADRFLREGRAAAALKSDHIITIYRADSANGVPYLAMEFLEGLPLDAWIKKQTKPVPLPHALRIVKDTLRGLATAHDKGLIHRDVKPANLWIEKGNSRIKLLDFGLTRSNDADMQLTQEGAVVGTPAYMAPEQASGKPVDPRADLFSVGVLLYHLLAGKNPFARKSLMETLGAIGYEAQPPLASVRPDVPKEYSDFVDRLLAKLPAGRPAHAKAALAELTAIEKRQQDGVQTLAPTVVAVPLPEPAQHVWGELDLDAAPTERSAVARSGVAPPPTASKNRTALYYGAGFAMFLVALVGLTLAFSGGGKTNTKPDAPKEVAKDDGKKSTAPPKRVAPARPANRAVLRFAPGDRAEARNVPYRTTTIVTVEAWLSVDKAEGPTHQTPVATPNGNLLAMDGAFGFYTFHGETMASDTIVPGRRVHVAGVHDGAARRIFVDGKPVAQTTDSGTIWPEGAKEGYLGTIAFGSEKFAGTIDAVRVSSTARYDKEFTPPATFAKDRDTFALYLFDEGQGDTLKDSSGNGYHAKIAGATWSTAEPDRAAAEFVIGRGGSVDIDGVGAVRDLRNVESLPSTPFKLLGAFATADTAAIADADLDRFRDLTALQDLQLTGTFTDAGLAKLTESRSAGTLRSLRLVSPDMADGAFASFAKLPALASLSFRGSKRFTGRGLADLKGAGLAWLALVECHAMEGAELAKLADLPKLTELQILHGTLTDDALRHVGKLTGLKGLSVYAIQGVGDAGARHLEGLVVLELLQIELSTFGEASFESFAKLPKLHTLGANNFKTFTPVAAKALAMSPALHTLALEASSLDDAGLTALAECKSLKILYARQSKITAAGAAAFRKARPDVTLQCDFPDDPDRKAAETILALGSLVVVRVDNVEKPLRDIDEIAGKSIEVVSVNVNRNKFVNDDTLECLRGLKHLTSAQLTNTAAGDRALDCLKDATKLETLILYNSKITDKGLDSLAGLTNLKNLNLTQLPNLSEAAVKALAAKIPQCRIAWNGGAIEPTK